MISSLVVRAGSARGRSHSLSGRNNQDGFALGRSEKALAAAVCDGCGSSSHSEVGAKLGARIVVDALLRSYAERPGAEMREHLRAVEGKLLEALWCLARATADPDGLLAEYLLFTILGFFVCGDSYHVFACGDGAFAVNGESCLLSSPENAPPYLAYRMLDCVPSTPAALEILAEGASRELSSIVVTTDGGYGALSSARIAEYIESDRFFGNPLGLQRALHSIMSGGRTGGDSLQDDATIAALRRRAYV